MAIDIDDPYGNNPYSVPLPPDTTGDPKWEKQPALAPPVAEISTTEPM
jgi:hypothetical protein